MNKQEAIKVIEKMGEYEHFVDEAISKKSVLNIINQIDEPEQPVIPQFVADWIEEHKEDRWWLSSAFVDRVNQTFREWIVLCDMDTRIIHQDIFARAWLDGYTVEQPQLYTVELPDPNRKGANQFYLGKADNTGKVFINKGKFNRRKNKNLWLTEEEICKDFEWAWEAGFAKEVEVENDSTKI